MAALPRTAALPSTERRMILRMLAYWEKLRRDRAMPSEQDINPADLHDLWDNCFLIRVEDLGKPDFHYTHLGPSVVDAYRFGVSKDDLADLLFPHAGSLAASYAQVIETRKPLPEEGEFRNVHNDLVKYRQCLLPLGEGEEVQAIFGGMRFHIIRAK